MCISESRSLKPPLAMVASVLRARTSSLGPVPTGGVVPGVGKVPGVGEEEGVPHTLTPCPKARPGSEALKVQESDYDLASNPLGGRKSRGGGDEAILHESPHDASGISRRSCLAR